MMNVIARTDGIDAREARVVEAAGENHVAIESIAAKADGREAHTHLKRDARFFGENEHGAAAAHHLHERAIESERVRRAAA